MLDCNRVDFAAAHHLEWRIRGGHDVATDTEAQGQHVVLTLLTRVGYCVELVVLPFFVLVDTVVLSGQWRAGEHVGVVQGRAGDMLDREIKGGQFQGPAIELLRMRLHPAEPKQVGVVRLQNEVVALEVLPELSYGVNSAEALLTPHIPVVLTRGPFARGAADDAADAIDLLHQ